MKKSNCAMKAKMTKTMVKPAKTGGGSASVKAKVMQKEKQAMSKKVKPNTYK
jgi:hypothetical protein